MARLIQSSDVFIGSKVRYDTLSRNSS